MRRPGRRPSRTACPGRRAEPLLDLLQSLPDARQVADDVGRRQCIRPASMPVGPKRALPVRTAAAGTFTGPVVLLSPSFSRRDESTPVALRYARDSMTPSQVLRYPSRSGPPTSSRTWEAAWTSSVVSPDAHRRRWPPSNSAPRSGSAASSRRGSHLPPPVHEQLDDPAFHTKRFAVGLAAVLDEHRDVQVAACGRPPGGGGTAQHRGQGVGKAVTDDTESQVHRIRVHRVSVARRLAPRRRRFSLGVSVAAWSSE